MMAEGMRERRLAPAGPRLGQILRTLEELPPGIHQADEADGNLERDGPKPGEPVEGFHRQQIHQPGARQRGKPPGVVELARAVAAGQRFVLAVEGSPQRVVQIVQLPGLPVELVIRLKDQFLRPPALGDIRNHVEKTGDAPAAR